MTTAAATTNEITMRKIAAEHLGVDPAKITLEANFIDDLNADSLDHIELVMAFEEEFDVEIRDSDAEAIKTFGDAVKLIDRLMVMK